MPIRTPLTVITGPLGSGKTTLLRHILGTVPGKIAILMNEFGEIAIDSKAIEGKNVRIAELAGGCVCCSLIGELEAAVEEVLSEVNPEKMLLETTGVAEPDALLFNIRDLAGVRLDGVVAVADADGLTAYPELGPTTRRQIEEADLILLNKTDLVSPEELRQARKRLSDLNPEAPVVETERCRVDPGLIFGLGRERDFSPPETIHEPEFEAVTYTSTKVLDRAAFEALLQEIKDSVYRAKGFVRFAEGSYLFNSVRGRGELEPFPGKETALVFIGLRGKLDRGRILRGLEEGEGGS